MCLYVFDFQFSTPCVGFLHVVEVALVHAQELAHRATAVGEPADLRVVPCFFVFWGLISLHAHLVFLFLGVRPVCPIFGKGGLVSCLGASPCASSPQDPQTPHTHMRAPERAHDVLRQAGQRVGPTCSFLHILFCICLGGWLKNDSST